MSKDNEVSRIRSEIDGRVLIITIANAEKKNAFSPAMFQDVSAALTELDTNPELWAGVILAEGDHFTAGLDMPKFFGPGAEDQPLPEGHIDPLGLTKRCSKPLVTAVQGICYTVGIEIMLAGDIVVAAESVRFSQMEAKRGIAPIGGAHFRYLTRMGWGDAMYHLMLCDEFGAERALKTGLVQEVVTTGSQGQRAIELAKLITQNAPLGIQATKAAALSLTDVGEAKAIASIEEIRAKVMGSADMMEGIRSFVERRAANFQGK
ncbi:MAG: crotonase/enoyl-CoA hydratase family protein [Pseudomonadota bacterium]